MKRKAISLILALALMLSMATLAVAAEVTPTNVANVTLDGVKIDTENLSRVVNGRTMIPVRCLAEQMGAEVWYDSELKAACILRAGVLIIMPIGSKTCTVNGEPFEMDIAPYIENGRTMIPARYVSELFGQSIVWVPDGRIAAVTEYKALAGDTNLEAWALAMGAYLNHANTNKIDVFGGKARGVATMTSSTSRTYTYQWARKLLSNSWSITSREELIETVLSMTLYGHNASFFESVAFIESMTDAEYQQIVNNATGMDKYMFPYTKELYKKWGDTGIVAWDWFRMSNLVQWGYLSGYITYPEALALLEPSATLLQASFDSWEEAYENYLDGYNWWAREDVLGKDTWSVTRADTVKKLLENKDIFNDDLFNTPIKSVEGVTVESILESILPESNEG